MPPCKRPIRRGALRDVAVLLTDCAKALLPLAGELAVKAVRQLRQRRA